MIVIVKIKFCVSLSYNYFSSDTIISYCAIFIELVGVAVQDSLLHYDIVLNMIICENACIWHMHNNNNISLPAHP